jgi:hypothetical protein
MSDTSSTSDPMLIACEAVLREISNYPITTERLLEALPLIREALLSIRAMDNVNVTGIEPMTVVRLIKS